MDTRTRAAGEGLTRAAIVEVALRLLDEVGLDGLSVRRLAAELGVKSPALYWHFRDKQELLDEMSEALQLAQEAGGPREGEDWRDWIARRARQRRDVLRGRRDGARLISGTRTSHAMLVAFDAELAALGSYGFRPADAARAIVTIGHYVTGFVLKEQADDGRGADGPPPSYAELLAVMPHLGAALVAGGDPQGEEAFEYGLRILIDGMEAARHHSAVRSDES